MDNGRRRFFVYTARVLLFAGSALLYKSLRAGSAEAAPAPLQSLRTRLHAKKGRLLSVGSRAYERCRRGFNLRLDSRPMGIALCPTQEAAAEALSWVKAHGHQVHLRSGGHAYEPIATGPGLLLDLAPLNSIAVNPHTAVVTVGAGARLGDIAEALAVHGLALPAGTCPSVGVAGLCLGGGYGMLSRRWGLTCDQLLSCELITADGHKITASPDHHPDLFWACRGGGGGQFALVTHLSLQAHRLPEVVQYKITWQPKDLQAAFSAWQQWAPSADDGFGNHFTVTAEAPSGVVAVEVTGLYAPASPDAGCDEAEVQRLLAPLLQTAKAELSCTKKPYIEAAREFGKENPHPVYFGAKSDFADAPLAADAIAALEQSLAGLPAGRLAAIFFPGGGAMARIAPEDSAFPHRQVHLGLQYYCAWEESKHTPKMMAALRQVYAQLHPYFSGAAYVNYVDLDIVDWPQAYFKDNYKRLQRIKRAYDPAGVFSSRPQAIS